MFETRGGENVGRIGKEVETVTHAMLPSAKRIFKQGARDIVLLARREHRFVTRTGALEQSIQMKTAEPVYKGGYWEMRVWLNPSLTMTEHNGVKRSYGVFQHEGTGQQTGGWIYPQKAKALRFFMNGNLYFRRRVRGIPPDQFLYKAGYTLVPSIAEKLKGVL